MGNPEQIGIAHYIFVITEHPHVGADPRVCPPAACGPLLLGGGVRGGRE